MKTLEPAYGGQSRPESEPKISNSALGMIAFIGTELMFFAALISAFLIISSAAEAWPPEGQPRLPIYVTALNSLVLFASGWMMFKAYQSFKATSFSEGTSKLVKTTMWLGIIFVAVQGIEWIRLLSYGSDYDLQPIWSIFLPDYRHPCYSRDRSRDRLEAIVSQAGKRHPQARNLSSCSTVLVLRRRRLANTLRVGVSELGKRRYR